MFLLKNITIAFFLVFFFTAKTANSQLTNYFLKSYKLQANAYGGNIFELNDEGFINSAANIDTIVNANHDTIIIEVIAMYRVNKLGNLVWAKNYILSSNCAYGGSLCLSIDSTIAVATVATDTVTYNPDYLFFKTDLNGNFISSNSIGSAGNEYAMEIKQLKDERYLICGYTDGNSVGLNTGDFNLVKLNKNGSLIFSKIYYDGNSSYDFPVGLEIDKAENAYLYGNTTLYDTASTTYAGQIVKVDKNGSLLWLSKHQPFPDPQKTINYHVTGGAVTSSNKLGITGHYTLTDTVGGIYKTTNMATFCLYKANGSIEFSKKYSVSQNQQYAYIDFGGIKQMKNLDFVISFSASDTIKQYSGFLIVDSTGQIKKTKVFSGFNNFSKLNTIKHGGVVSTGIDYNTYNSLIAKLDSNLNISCEYDTALFTMSPINFINAFGGVSSNLGAEHPSGVKANPKTVGDTTYCQKTIFIATPTSTTTAVSDTSVVVTIPNIFTPNDDGKNEFFGLTSNHILNDFELIIYDRWGLKVYESNDYLTFWNGKYLQHGKDCTDGTYFYIIKYSCATENKKLHGFLTLMR